MAFWLVKTEPRVYSIEDLAKDKVTHWEGVRNYQARNYLKEMVVGDRVLIYHSNDEQIGIVGVAMVSKTAYPDPSQFDRSSHYYDPKATKEEPRWFSPEIKFLSKFKDVLLLSTLKGVEVLNKMVLLQRGSRLSVQPVSELEFKQILKLSEV